VYYGLLNDVTRDEAWRPWIVFMLEGIVKRQTASVYLKQLVDIGVLVEESSGREKLFVHTKFVRLMTVDSNDIAR